MSKEANVDLKTVEGFADEWGRFDQTALSTKEHEDLFDRYFAIFPWHLLPRDAEGFDLGCGSGRWARLVAPRVGRLHCIDPSDALAVARRQLAQFPNCVFHRATVDAMPLDEGTMDFGYALGVLHHIPDTQAGIEACVRTLKSGAPFLLYLYYAFDNRPIWYRGLWHLSDVLRHMISQLPYGPRYAASCLLAFLIYLPLAKLSWAAEKAGLDIREFPLSSYRHCSVYTIRTDSLDRFGTRLEHRFTRAHIAGMMEMAGLERIEFSPHAPFWCAIGYRSSGDANFSRSTVL